ncbi:hypothetical protein [Bradyrhizobium sp. LA6.1]|uniref:hypothetical protein n=1 Tax=Bradyrhizobium sp. LA6.1 TaxID=3156378 RepID=UPI0033976696
MLGDLDDFVECCGDHAWYHADGWISLQFAADNLQALAERWGLVAEIGQDGVQAVMAEAFAPAPELPSDYVLQLVKRFELDDPRDRWKWTGKLPPAPEKASEPRPRPIPQSTVDAFNYVVSLGDADRLRKWLRDHTSVAHMLVSEAA